MLSFLLAALNGLLAVPLAHTANTPPQHGSEAASLVAMSRILNPNRNLSHASPVGSTASYSIVDLGSLLGYPYPMTPFSINDGGVIGGSARFTGAPPADTMATLYQNGVVSGLGGTPGYNSSVINAINNSGYAVGAVLTAPNQNYIRYQYSRAVSYTNGHIQQLGSLPGDGSSVANGVNAHDEAIETSYLGFVGEIGGESAVIFQGGTVRRIASGFGMAINNHGTALINGVHGAAIYSSQGVVVIPSLYRTLHGYVYGMAINDSGAAVGQSTDFFDGFSYAIDHAFEYDGEHVRDLGVPDGYTR